jgi:uncharacterized membrane protein YuzA (DUF378 family)
MGKVSPRSPWTRLVYLILGLAGDLVEEQKVHFA